jgi:hypothetical protein
MSSMVSSKVSYRLGVRQSNGQVSSSNAFRCLRSMQLGVFELANI